MISCMNWFKIIYKYSSGKFKIDPGEFKIICQSGCTNVPECVPSSKIKVDPTRDYQRERFPDIIFRRAYIQLSYVVSSMSKFAI